MTGAAPRLAFVVVALLFAARCEFHGVAPLSHDPTEGSPPLSVIAAPLPRPPVTVAPEEAEALGNTAPLVPLYAALEALEQRRAAAPVVIMQLGDSHTAADFFSGRLRERFQERFGAAGRGMLPPGIPYPYYHPALVRVAETPGWQRASSFAVPGPFGMGGVVQQTAQAGAGMTLTETEPAGFDRAFFEVLRQPQAGTLRLQVDEDTAHDFATAAPLVAPHWVEFDTPRRSHTMTLTARGDGSVTLLSWGTQRETPGVVYENLGISGATIAVTGHWDPGIVAGELGRREPAVIVVAYGTNEAAEPAAQLGDYARLFRNRVAALRAAAPQAAILVVGPPDMNKRGQAPVAGCDARDAGWAPPPGVALVRDAQREVAAREGWYFWDWQQAMGGACAIDRWERQTPPLAYPDHVHLQAAGYRRSADALFGEIMDGYRRYRARPGAPRIGS
ncbi:MAG TPA: GDSL-type esterase/lipase family protein [Stellaceae bacterium]|nr:GDSL-type esterase/lipase family protein [Stellaceae bacterium]